MNSSTLVATVSINYEDFAEGFLTCGTCLYAYDQEEHSPKLLSCSHTICRSCLERIASSPTLNNCQQGHIRCPICRQTIAIPDGGVGALPPSFLINQLFDLVNKKPREFIPKCSVHLSQELLFCETCDSVFCDYCNNESGPNKHINAAVKNGSTNIKTTTSFTANSNNKQTTNAKLTLTDEANNPPTISPSSNNARSQTTTINSHDDNNHANHDNAPIEEHTVIPFSIAIKRMSEILHYRGQQCISKLNEAAENVQKEIDKLDANSASATENIDKAFNQIKSIIDKRKKELLSEAKKLKENKRNVLIEQMKIIENEKSKVNLDGVKIKNQMDVKNLSKKINDLTERNEAAQTLFAPRENCFICFEEQKKETIDCITKSMKNFGSIRTSKTYPPFCTANIVKCATYLKSVAQVQSIDYNGCKQKYGGDPISAKLTHHDSKNSVETIEIVDNRDGTYDVFFLPPEPGKYQLSIFIFNRPIKNSPIEFETCAHHNPVSVFGQRGKDNHQFHQPVGLAINKNNGRLYILDSFNSRIKLLAQSDNSLDPFNFMLHLKPDCLGRSCTSIALLYRDYEKSLDCNDENCQKELAQIKLLTHGSNQDIYLEAHQAALGLKNGVKAPNPNILVTNWKDHVVYELEPKGKIAKKYEDDSMVEPTLVVVDNNNDVVVVDRNLIFIFDSISGKLKTKLNGYTRADKTESSICEKGIDNVAKKPTPPEQPARPEVTPPPRPIMCVNNMIVANSQAGSEKIIISDKSSTLKHMSGKKPSLNSKASSTLQRGSKAMFSAASKLKSTFTLPHSSTLVNSVSLQSMFKHQESRSNEKKINRDNKITNNMKSNLVLVAKDGYQIDYDEKSIKLSMADDSLHGIRESDIGQVKTRQTPFGIIGGIAIGPDNDLIIADESKILVLSPKLQYSAIREITVLGDQAKTGHGTFSGLEYDSGKDLLLCLRNEKSRSFIQIIDYRLGKLKFTIDSHDSRLMRPSCLAAYNNHLFVADLGDDCIKKYRYY